MLYPINVRTKFSVLPLCITRQLLYNYKRCSVHNLHQVISGYYTKSCHNTPPVTVTKEYKTYKRIINARKKIDVLIKVSMSTRRQEMFNVKVFLILPNY